MAELWEYSQSAGSEIEHMIDQRVEDIVNLLHGEGLVRDISRKELRARINHTKIDDHVFSSLDSQDNHQNLPLYDNTYMESEELACAGIA